ncbi:MAG: leucyl aminopeptidase [Heliobacteriaceae bacterium]|jgi:leucyl aminopeptidase|nr:leucyl aminopeptidase [Heliobacteriaceae bacterium]
MEIKVLENANNVPCEVIVVSMFEGEKTSQELANKFALEKDNFEGKFGQTYLLHTLGQSCAEKILVLGLGKRDEFCPDKLREAAAKAVKKLISIKAKNAVFDLDVEAGKQAVTGALIGNYAFDKYKTEKADRLDEVSFARFSQNDIDEAKIFGEALEFARNIANEPAQYATPSKLAELAQSFNGLETRVFERDEIEEMGMNAFLAVGRGSSQPPKFIHMKYTCANPQKKIAVIGKGICFDSGGLDIKPASSMLTMKDDMAGAACVLGVMSVLYKLNPQAEVHGIIAACENMPGDKAYKPGDILTAKNGKTIEIDNTDAEGRLTLADALCYANELGADEIIDIATLTGACCVALGSAAAGIMGNDEEFIQRLIETAGENGERLWQLPLYKEYKESLKSSVADMKNTGSRFGGASTAGVFLQEFIKDVKWAHIDIAGTAFLEKPEKEFIAGSTGAGVRTLLGYIALDREE